MIKKFKNCYIQSEISLCKQTQVDLQIVDLNKY